MRVTAQHLDEQVSFSVADTGIGIDPQYHPYLFQDFSQIPSALQKKVRGTGLGLALSKRLAELLGGSVQVRSELGRGSVFSVTVPVNLVGEQHA